MIASLDRRFGQCAYPLWSEPGEAHMVCGEAVKDLSRPYCTACSKLAYVPKRKRNRVPDPNHEPRKFTRQELLRLEVAA